MDFNEKNRKEWIEKVIGEIPKGQSILDAGAGELANKKYCGHLKYVSQDFCEYEGGGTVGLQFEKWDVSKIDIVSDITNIPVEDKSFDNILCSEVFEHIVNPALAVKEFSRIIKDGGRLIITAPFCSLTHMAPYHYASGYSRFWYEEVLQENGFKIIEMIPNGNYFSYLLQELERLPSVMERYTTEDLRVIRRKSHSLCGFLRKYENVHNDSSELLCFGWHIVAKREQ